MLLGGVARGATVLLAADHVYEEMYDHLTGQARRGFSETDVVECFERMYLPALRFVTMPAWPVPDRVLPVGAADWDDAPTAALALLVAPSLVFSFDKALVDAGFGCADDWLALTFLADGLLGYDGTLLVAGLAARAAGRRAWQAERWFLRDLRPTEVAAGLTIGIAVVWAAPRGAATLTAATERGVRQLGRATSTIGTAVAQVVAEAGRHRFELHAAAVAPDSSVRCSGTSCATLAISGEPMPTEMLSAAVQRPEAEVDATLAGHAAFVRTPTWLAARAAPPAAASRRLGATSAVRSATA